MPATIQQLDFGSFHPGLQDFARHNEIRPERPVCADFHLRRGDRVLHDHWGLGRVIRTDGSSCSEITVHFSDGERTAPAHSLRRLLPRTVLAQLIEKNTSTISSWTVRKADEQGVIEPDARGRFAGHSVNYYDESRIPRLIEQLSKQDTWNIGAMVFHPEYGPGQVVVAPAAISPRIPRGMQLVTFFDRSSPLPVSVQQLRCLLPGHRVANRLGVNRKTFSRLARRKGICPDYVVVETRVREFYDEGRMEDIRRRWFAPERMESFRPGAVVLDRHGEIARVGFRDAEGQLHLHYSDTSAATEPAAPASVRLLVSLRELSRSQGMSRYKVSRLLNAAGVRPVHRGAKTFYFDGSAARKALRDRVDREESAVSLRALADRTGVSVAVLARKVRQGCICTTGQVSHAVDAGEAARIEQVVRALESRRESLKSLGICQLQPRGRTGQEVTRWDISQLIGAAQSSTTEQLERLFGQVAWLCDGAGRHRMIEALKCFLLSCYKIAGHDRQLVRRTQVLLALLNHLPAELAAYRSHIAFLASGGPLVYSGLDELRSLARETGLESPTSYERFQARIHQSVADLLILQESILFSTGGNEPLSRRGGCLYPEDDFVRGAVIASVRDQKPEVGIIVRVEQQAWNALARCWEKTVLVRFTDGERRMNPCTRPANGQQCKGGPVVLLRAAEAAAVLHSIRKHSQVEGVPPQLVRRSEKKAS